LADKRYDSRETLKSELEILLLPMEQEQYLSLILETSK